MCQKSNTCTALSQIISDSDHLFNAKGFEFVVVTAAVDF